MRRTCGRRQAASALTGLQQTVAPTMYDDETSRYASGGVMLAVSEPLVYVVAQNDSDIAAGEQNQGRIAEMGHFAYLRLWAFEKAKPEEFRVGWWVKLAEAKVVQPRGVYLVLHVDGSLGGAQVEKT